MGKLKIANSNASMKEATKKVRAAIGLVIDKKLPELFVQ
jgi:hypothetical protein